MKIIAIDMGGTQTRLALYDMNGNQLDKFVFATYVENPNKQIETICQYINEKKQENKISVIGMCSPGPLDIDNGVMLDLPNLPKFKNFRLTDAICKSTGINCHLIGDAQAATAGEASQYDDGSTNVFFTISTGFGAGLVIDGENYMGTNKIAMEIFDSKFTYINYKGDVSIRT
ncbi:MAG: ROK family protein, partial [Mycoplasmatales bacterium]